MIGKNIAQLYEIHLIFAEKYYWEKNDLIFDPVAELWKVARNEIFTLKGGSHVPFCPVPFLLFTSEGDVKWGTKRDKRGQKGTKIRNQIL